MSVPWPSGIERTCPKCEMLQESPGSTVCEQCGADLVRPVVTKSSSPRSRPQLGQLLGGPARLLLEAPLRLLKGVIAALQWLVALTLKLVFLTLRVVASLLVLGVLVVGLSYVAEVRARVPVVKEVATTAQEWLQRAQDLGVRLIANLKAEAQPPQRAPSSAATSQKPAPTRSAAAQPSLTVKSTPSGATVLLNARRVGKTPVTLRIAPGTYKVTISRPGYATVTRTISVKLGKAASLSVTLVAR